MQAVAAVVAFLFLVCICVAIGFAIGRTSAKRQSGGVAPGVVNTPNAGPTPGAPTSW